MAFKDEIEVARHATKRPAFAALRKEEFEPGFKINYHMARHRILAQDAAAGRPVKRAFVDGSRLMLSRPCEAQPCVVRRWMCFGYTQERPREVALHPLVRRFFDGGAAGKVDWMPQ